MSYAALASIYRSDKLVGVRLFDTDRCVCVDKPISEIVFALSRSTPISVINLGADNGDIKWTMGVEDRYASIDLNNGKLTNGDSAVAIGITDGDPKKYKLVNYTGKVLIVDEATAIKYARDYQIANCKLYDNGKPHLQAINGNIPKMSTKGSIQFSKSGGVIFNLPEDCSVTEFTLPSRVDGIDISDCCNIQVKPIMAAKAIKTLRISRGYKAIYKEYIYRFPNIEKVFIDGDVGIMSEAFYGMKSLREVHINGYTYVNPKAFEGCCNLRVFNVHGFNTGYPNEIFTRAFYGCVNLDIQKVMDAGPTAVGPHAFSGAHAKELVLPEETVRIADSAFAGVVGLSKIKLMASNPHFNITMRRDRKPTFVKNKIGVTIAIEELNLGFPCTLDIDANSDLEDLYKIADNITIVRHASMVDDKSIRILTKGQALGLKLEGKELSKTADIMSVIGAFSEADICSELNKIRPEQFFNYSNKVIKLGDFRIPLQSRAQRMFEYPDRIRTVDGFTVLAVKKGIHRYFAFLMLDKSLIIESNRAICDKHPDARSLYPPIIIKAAAGRLMSIEKVGNAEYVAKFNSGDVIKLDAKAVIESAQRL